LLSVRPRRRGSPLLPYPTLFRSLPIDRFPASIISLNVPVLSYTLLDHRRSSSHADPLSYHIAPKHLPFCRNGLIYTVHHLPQNVVKLNVPHFHNNDNRSDLVYLFSYRSTSSRKIYLAYQPELSSHLILRKSDQCQHWKPFPLFWNLV